jgi:DnaK suppressor protein
MSVSTSQRLHGLHDSCPKIVARTVHLRVNLEGDQDVAMILTRDLQRRLEEQRATIERSHGDGRFDTQEELTETQAALRRIELGTYGRCESCGGAIGRQRLLALPTARYCLGCAHAG